MVTVLGLRLLLHGDPGRMRWVRYPAHSAQTSSGHVEGTEMLEPEGWGPLAGT